MLKLFARSLTRYEVRVLLVERAATARAAIVANFTASASSKVYLAYQEFVNAMVA